MTCASGFVNQSSWQPVGRVTRRAVAGTGSRSSAGLVNVQLRTIGSLLIRGAAVVRTGGTRNRTFETAQSGTDAALDARWFIENADVYGFDLGGTGFGRSRTSSGSVLDGRRALR